MIHTIFVGAYSTVITTLAFDDVEGTLKVTGTVDAGSMPSWIALHPTDRSLLFASNEVDEGKILMYKVIQDGETHKLELLQTAWAGGAGTAHFHVGENEVVAADYSSGTLLTIPLELSPPKMLAPACPPVTFTFPGVGPDADRQEGSHPHQVLPHTSGKTLLIPDLGSDKVWQLEKDAAGQAWKVAGEIPTAPGHGPRHVVVKGETLYVLNELESSLSTYSLPAEGECKRTATLSTLTPPRKAVPGMLAAEILLSETEDLIYTSNRNEPHDEGDSIAIFTTTESSAGFSLVNEVRTGLNHLRAVTFAGEGNKWVIAGGLNGGGIKVFERIDQGRSLKEVAHLAPGVVERPTSFIMV